MPRVVGPVKGVCRLPVRASRCRCKLSLHICELVHDITSIYYIYEMKFSMVAPPLSGLRMRTLSGGARHFVEKQHLREDPIPPPHLHALKMQG